MTRILVTLGPTSVRDNPYFCFDPAQTTFAV